MKITPMKPNDFYYKWEPNGWPAISQNKKEKAKYMRDLRRVGQWYLLKDKFKSEIF
jgi:hypothetical protein